MGNKNLIGWRRENGGIESTKQLNEEAERERQRERGDMFI